MKRGQFLAAVLACSVLLHLGCGQGECSAECGKLAFVGDGICDDGNNNCGCDWDEGDCCGESGKTYQFNYCDDCACLDPDYDPDYEAQYCSSPCVKLNFVGDGFCDDDNNVCGCDWDNGDCCGDSGKNAQFNCCDDCLCLDPAMQDLECAQGCGTPAWQGDGHCDDGNNLCGCDWDLGDCCDTNGNFNYCTVCLCMDPSSEWYFAAETTTTSTVGETTLYSCAGDCEGATWVGDSFCNDGNNICGCDWDGGDCCDDISNYSLCDDCLCADPLFST